MRLYLPVSIRFGLVVWSSWGVVLVCWCCLRYFATVRVLRFGGVACAFAIA